MSRRVLIVDDEAPARTRIRHFIEKTYPDFLVEEASDGFEALEKFPIFYPDLLFLDIEMPELTGFDVISQAPAGLFQVIFQTAYDEFALRAFEVNACDYLLKPCSDDRLKQAIERAMVRPADNHLKKLSDHLVSGGVFLERFVVRVGLRSKLVESRDVLYFESRDHLTYINTEVSNYTYDSALSDLEEKIDPKVFVRVHRNAIVNLKAIVEFRHSPPFSVTLSNKTIVPVSRNRAGALREILTAST